MSSRGRHAACETNFSNFFIFGTLLDFPNRTGTLSGPRPCRLRPTLLRSAENPAWSDRPVPAAPQSFDCLCSPSVPPAAADPRSLPGTCCIRADATGRRLLRICGPTPRSRPGCGPVPIRERSVRGHLRSLSAFENPRGFPHVGDS